MPRPRRPALAAVARGFLLPCAGASLPRSCEIRRLPPRSEMGEGDSDGGGVGASTAEAAASSSSASAEPVTVRDIRRYKCEFCGVVRSKKRLIRDHVLEHHEDEVDDLDECTRGGGGAPRASHDCEECGAGFKKPAHLN